MDEPLSDSREDLFEHAVLLHEAGRLADAIEIYRRLVELEGEDPVVLELLGGALRDAGRPEEARRCLDRCLELDSSPPTPWLQRGMLRESSGDRIGALADYRAAHERDPGSAEVGERLGRMLIGQEDLEGAWLVLDRVLGVASEAWSLRRDRATLALRRGRLDVASEDLDRLLAADPDDVNALSLLARLRSLQGQPRRALQAARRAFRVLPESPVTAVNLATALASTGEASEAMEAISFLDRSDASEVPPRDRTRITAMAEIVLGRLPEASERLRGWVDEHPDDAEVLGMLATALRQSGRLSEALAVVGRAVAVDRDSFSLQIEHGRVLLAQGDAEAAIAVLAQAWEASGRSGPASLELYSALHRRGLVTRALEVIDAALSRDESDVALRAARMVLRTELGRHAEALQDGAFLEASPDASGSHASNYLLSLQYPGSLDEPMVTETHARVAPRVGAATGSRSSEVRPDETRPLRVGWVSGDLKAHSVTWFLGPLLRSLDRRRLSSVAYSNTVAGDAVTDALRGRFAEWREVRGSPDEVVSGLIRTDQIDVLIDLSGHTGENRLGVFRAQPAPVQITWLGYPNTTGLPEMGWRLVDEVTDPEGSDHAATEALLRMAAPFLCFDAELAAIDVPRRPDRPPVFGSFNNTAKLSDSCLVLWSAVLRAVPESRLLLKSRQFEDPGFRAAMLDRLDRCGVAPSRIELQGFAHGVAAHHGAYGKIDVALDTFPYHGTTTTCEALWNGVPVVSRVGRCHRARVGKTLLRAVGLPELACEDDASFVETAVELARDAARRRALHEELRQRMRSSRLCDATDFATRFEAAIRHAWVHWCRGLPPRAAFLGRAGGSSAAAT